MNSYIRRALQILVQFGVMAALLFGGAGDLSWGWGWAYFAFAAVNLAINFRVFPREIVEARSEVHKDIPRWERIVTFILMLLTIALFSSAGLDHRFQASPPLPVALHLVGLVLLSCGSGLSTWAIVSNRFFATQVRIQSERGHTVERNGPYRWIRHPGYAGFIVTWCSVPLVFGTLLALIPACAIAALFAVRTGLEDIFLQKNLPGYRDYSAQVRWRLIPHVW